MTYYDLFMQGPGVYIPTLVVSLLITLIAYGLFPLLYASLVNKTVVAKKYKHYCYGINLVPMFLFFLLSDKPSPWAYLLWTSVFSALGQRIMKNRYVLEGHRPFSLDLQEDSVSQSGASSINIRTNETDHGPSKIDIPRSQRYCKFCGGVIDQETKQCTKCSKQYLRNPLKMAPRSTVIVSLILILSLTAFIVLIYQQNQKIALFESKIIELESTLKTRDLTIDQLTEQIADKNDRMKRILEERNSLSKERNSLAQKSAFMDKHIVFVLDDGSRVYHTYECTSFGVSFFGYAIEDFWAYNIEAAKQKGYKPCQYCCFN